MEITKELMDHLKPDGGLSGAVSDVMKKLESISKDIDFLKGGQSPAEAFKNIPDVIKQCTDDAKYIRGQVDAIKTELDTVSGNVKNVQSQVDALKGVPIDLQTVNAAIAIIQHDVDSLTNGPDSTTQILAETKAIEAVVQALAAGAGSGTGSGSGSGGSTGSSGGTGTGTGGGTGTGTLPPPDPTALDLAQKIKALCTQANADAVAMAASSKAGLSQLAKNVQPLLALYVGPNADTIARTRSVFDLQRALSLITMSFKALGISTAATAATSATLVTATTAAGAATRP